LTITATQPAPLALKVRYPSWAASGMTVSINGKPETIGATRGSYATIERQWKTGDRIDVRLPMSLHTEAMPDDPNMIAVMYGPIVLAGDLGKAESGHRRSGGTTQGCRPPHARRRQYRRCEERAGAWISGRRGDGGLLRGASHARSARRLVQLSVEGRSRPADHAGVRVSRQ